MFIIYCAILGVVIISVKLESKQLRHGAPEKPSVLVELGRMVPSPIRQRKEFIQSDIEEELCSE